MRSERVACVRKVQWPRLWDSLQHFIPAGSTYDKRSNLSVGIAKGLGKMFLEEVAFRWRELRLLKFVVQIRPVGLAQDL